MPVISLNRRGLLASTVGMLCVATGRLAMAETETPPVVAATDPQQPASPEPAPSAPISPEPAPSVPIAKVEEAGPAPQEAEAASAVKQLPAPKGRVILSISGKISVTNGEGVARFDREMLESLGITSFTTKTPWYDMPVTFEGVRLDRLMSVIEATGDNLRATALDEYTTAIPTADFARYHPILAMKRDGNYLPLRDKGPLFIVYPYDSELELQHQRFYSRSAWQVVKMVVM